MIPDRSMAPEIGLFIIPSSLPAEYNAVVLSHFPCNFYCPTVSNDFQTIYTFRKSSDLVMLGFSAV